MYQKSLLVFLVSASACLTVGLANIVPYKDCGSKIGTIKSIDVSNCPQLPCDFKKGTNISVAVNFTANGAISEASTKVYGYIAGIKTPFPLPDNNACHSMTCPIAASAAVTYNTKVFVQSFYPQVQVIVQWELHTPDDMIICFTLPAKIIP